LKKLFLILGIAGLFTIAYGLLAEAQMQPPPTTGSPKLKGKNYYDPSNVVVVSGRVTEVKRSAAEKSQRVYVHLYVQAPQGRFSLFLGPAAYVDGQPVKIIAGDQVEVTGFRMSKTRIYPIQIRKGNQVLRLRDVDGHRLWLKRKKPGM
jgi:hypothetical protein